MNYGSIELSDEKVKGEMWRLLRSCKEFKCSGNFHDGTIVEYNIKNKDNYIIFISEGICFPIMCYCGDEVFLMKIKQICGAILADIYGVAKSGYFGFNNPPRPRWYYFTNSPSVYMVGSQIYAPELNQNWMLNLCRQQYYELVSVVI